MKAPDEWKGQYSRPRKKATRQLWEAIWDEFEAQRPPMTVRQVFYRMTAANVVRKTESGYRQVQRALSNMRRANVIPYEHVADHTRIVRKPPTYRDPEQMLREMIQFYRRDPWDNQTDHVEIWLEKDALVGVIESVTKEFDTGLYVTRGYPSLSYVYEAGQLLRRVEKPIYIYHFGDFDASGKDAARKVREELARSGARFEFEEVAINEAQIEEIGLQTRLAKKSDPRSKNWGNRAVELDAIPPADLREMVREVIGRHVDADCWNWTLEKEQEDRMGLAKVITDFCCRSKA